MLLSSWLAISVSAVHSAVLLMLHCMCHILPFPAAVLLCERGQAEEMAQPGELREHDISRLTKALSATLLRSVELLLPTPLPAQGKTEAAQRRSASRQAQGARCSLSPLWSEDAMEARSMSRAQVPPTCAAALVSPRPCGVASLEQVQ